MLQAVVWYDFYYCNDSSMKQLCSAAYTVQNVLYNTVFITENQIG